MPPDRDLRALANWIDTVSLNQVPASVLHAARLQLANMLAAALASHNAPEAHEVIGALDAIGGKGKGATTLLDGKKRPILDAVLANASASMVHDFDDIVWMGHTGHSAVFASLAVAEHEGKSFGDLLLAIIVANEIGGRLGASSFFGPLNGQMWSFIHLLGAAGATAKLLGLGNEQTLHALSIALYQPNFPLQPGFMRPTSKLLTAATPTCSGIQATYLARAGMTGDPRVLDDARGFWNRFSFLPLRNMLGGLGTTWVTSTLACKTYPGCFYHQTACTAIERILKQTGSLAVGDIENVTIESTKLAVEVSRFSAGYGRGEPLTPIGVTFDLRMLAALMLLRGHLTTDDLEPSAIASNESTIRSLGERIALVHDPLLSARVVQSAMSLETGRDTIRSLRVSDLARIARSYRREYHATALSVDDLRTVLRSAMRRETQPNELLDARGIPLYFPSRVSLRLRDGRSFTERQDLPVGAFADAGSDERIKAKFLRAANGVVEMSAASAWWDSLMSLDMSEAISHVARPVK